MASIRFLLWDAWTFERVCHLLRRHICCLTFGDKGRPRASFSILMTVDRPLS